MSDGSPPLGDDDPLTHGTVKTGCSADTKSSVSYYHDYTCDNSVKSVTNSFDQCMPIFHSDASNSNPTYANYIFGDCLRSSSSNSADDDELSMSSAAYAGSISGALIGGLVVGIVVSLVIGLVCLKCGSTKASKGLNERLVN